MLFKKQKSLFFCAGVDINAGSNSGQTPLHLACTNRDAYRSVTIQCKGELLSQRSEPCNYFPPGGSEWIISVVDYVDNSFTALGNSDPREVRLEL